MAHWAWYPTGGDWTYVKGICDLYESKGHNVIPFSVKNAKNTPSDYEKYFLDEVDYKEFYKKINIKKGISTAVRSIYSNEAVKKLNFLIDENKVDIAQLNTITNYHTPSIIPVLKKAKIPIVWRIMDYRLICPNTTLLSNDKICTACFKSKFYNCVVKKCKKQSIMASALLALENYTYSILPFYKDVDLFLFQSEFTRDIFVKNGFDEKKSEIIPNAYDYSKIMVDYQNDNYILYFGRISREKGIKTLMRAMMNLPNIELKIIGDGPQLQEYKDFKINESLSNVTFLGPMWGDKLDPFLRKTKFTIVPSTWYEPSGYVVLQSFAYGKPVISSNMGGLKDIVRDDYNGMLFEAGNEKELALKINQLYKDDDLCRLLGVNARRTLECNHSNEKYYKESMNIFNNLINNRN